MNRKATATICNDGQSSALPQLRGQTWEILWGIRLKGIALIYAQRIWTVAARREGTKKTVCVKRVFVAQLLVQFGYSEMA
jgi:hypothetical protein